MNANLAHTLDSLFGPPSGLINVSEFLESPQALPTLPENEQTFASDIIDQCSVHDIQDSLQEVWSNPTLSAYLIKDHDHTVTALHSLSQRNSKAGRKSHLPDPDTLGVEVAHLQGGLDTVVLKSFKLNTDAVLFMRTPKHSDQNILHKKKVTVDSDKTAEEREAIFVISVHSKVTWGPSYVTRTSQHAFVSSQSLGDVYTAIPCMSRELPSEVEIQGQADCVICIEDIAYSHESASGDDYADKLIQQLALSNKKETKSLTKASTSLGNTRLSSLSLRINEPYWLIHRGNCEHFLVIDQIRLMHPLDPSTGYPLTLQIIPTILDICRACGKVPAVWSIVGDVRLGESPCLLCGPCWRNMGPSSDAEVIVSLLPENSYN